MSESSRLNALQNLDILDTVREERFDRLTRLAANALGIETAIITFVDDDRTWFKSQTGFDANQVPREVSFCTEAIKHPDVLVVPNPATDSRFRNNPLVTSDPNIAFYAGAPLITRDGHALGTLCVLDTKPHPDFSDRDVSVLRDIATSVMMEIEHQLQEQHVRDLELINHELQHRMGNMYAHMSSLISMISRTEVNKDSFVRRLREKIASLGQTQALLSANDWESVSLTDLAEATIWPLIDEADRKRITIEAGPDLRISPRGAFILTLMLNELCTNAMKHGALNSETGSISLKWSLGEKVEFVWREDVDISAIGTPGQGFGSQILNRIVPLDLKGEVHYDLLSSGLVYRVTATPERMLLMTNKAD